MLEPVAAVIFNTVLCGRSTLEHPIPLHSVSKIIKYPASTRLLPVSFFNPQPRRAELKGKGKAVDGTVFAFEDESSRVREWTCTSGRTVFPSNKRARAIMTGSFKPRMLKYPSFQRTASSIIRHASHNRLPSPRLFSHPVQSHSRPQARQASQMAEIQHSDANSLPSSTSTSERFHRFSIIFPSGPLYDRRLIAVQHFRRMMAQPHHVFDLDTSLAIYEAVQLEEALSLLLVDELLVLLERALDNADHHYDSLTTVHTLHDWGTRLSRLATTLERRVVVQSEYAHRRLCALARAHALMGDLEEAAKIVESTKKLLFPYEDRWRAIHAFQSLVQAAHRYYDSTRVLTFVAAHWMTFGSHMSRWSAVHQHGKPEIHGCNLRKAVQRIVSQIQHPVSFLASLESDASHKRILGELLIESYSFNHLPLLGLDVHNELKRQNIHTLYNLQLSLVRALVREDAMGPAKELFASIPRSTTFKYYLQTGLYMFAHDGDHVRAEEYYNRLSDQEWRNELDFAMLMHSYATQGNSDKVNTLFNQYFPRERAGARQNSPNVIHYTIAMYSHARNGDIDGLNMWLEDLAFHSLRPDAHVFTMLAQAFAKRGDLESVATVLSQMRSSGIAPNEVTYHNLITLLAHRRDPIGAEAMYKRAIQEGIVPSRRLVSAVMNAHVQAGSWKGVIRVFDYIRSRPTLNIRLTIEVYNTLLKAYVLIGAPFRVVSKLFNKLYDAGVRPDSYTYALLIKSACDAEELDMAKDIYQEMCELSVNWESNVYVNVYVLTIMIAGYLRRRDVEAAREMYDEMGRRGIQPDATTFSIMIHSYAQHLTTEGITIAEDFIKDLTQTLDKAWLIPQIAGRHTATTALEKIYGPLLDAYARLSRPGDVEHTLNTMLEKGGELSLGVLTTLMDVYRRAGNIEAVQECWPQIYDLGLKYAKESILDGYTPDDPTVERLRANILCIPLSIYVDAMSVAGKHTEVATVWKEFQDHGFYFDSYNWNYLLVALLRAGEVSRAFQIGEKIILPYQRHSLTMNLQRDQTPSSPLSFHEKEKEQSAELMNVTSEAKPVNPRQRRRFLYRNKRRLHGLLHLEYEKDEFGDDFAEPLHVLYQIAPSWNVWRVHPVAMRALLWSFHSLTNGHIIHPLGQESPRVDIAESRAQAEELLKKIGEECPDTVKLVRRYGKRLRRKLGREVYAEKFSSG